MKSLSAIKQFKEALVYLKESLKFIYISIGIFILSAILGFLLRTKLTFIDEYLKQLVERTAGLNIPEMIFFILQNNLQSSLFAILLGTLLGIFPLLSTVSNGAIIGYVLGRTYDIAGLGVWWRLIPHGIFELPAVFIALGLGLKLGLSIFTKNPSETFKERFYNSMNVFLMVILPLLIIAAVIEGLLIIFLE